MSGLLFDPFPPEFTKAAVSAIPSCRGYRLGQRNAIRRKAVESNPMNFRPLGKVEKTTRG